MKLYVWTNPYDVSYGSAMVFAVAKSLREAKKQAAKGASYKFCDLGSGEPMNWTKDLGKPTRVVKLPCAEWHEWSE